MIHIQNLREGGKIFDALNSDARIAILEMIMEHKELNLDYFAKKLNISNSAITMHIKKLAESGLIKIKTASGVRGSKKICYLNCEKLIVDFENEIKPANVYSFELNIGHFSNYSILPTCGLATSERIIGEFDDTRYFSFPERYDAALIWFASGYLEYKIPNNLKPGEVVKELQLSMEIASEAPGFSNYYPSDIYFSVNGVKLGFWTSPGEFNDRKGMLTPSWWFDNLGQYGKLKMLSINSMGSFIDGIKISDVKIDALNIMYNSAISFEISAPATANNAGGLTIFGKGFGDYNSGIDVKMLYDNEK